MKKYVRFMLVIVYGLCVSEHSYADHLVLGDSSDLSSLSGYSGTLARVNIGEVEHTYKAQGYDETHYDKTVTTYAGMKGITWGEDKDKPCEIFADPKVLNPKYKYEDGSTAKAYDRGFDICKGKAGNDKSVSFTNALHFVRGVAVCTTDKKDTSKNRLKGIRIYAAEVKSNGTVTSLKTQEENRHTNCRNNWHKPVYCPSGHIASGLKVYYKDKSFTGLGLKCREIETSTSPNKPG